MRTFRATLCAALLLSPATAVAARQDPSSDLPVSLARIREDLEKPPPPRLTPAAPVQLRPTFKTRVDQRTWVLTLEEALQKQFDLTPMQRQSAEWQRSAAG